MIDLPHDATCLRLGRYTRKDRLVLCETVRFLTVGGACTTLRRAAISGRVDVGGEIQGHFVDALNDDGDMVATIALDSASYKALKTHWMRCKVARDV